MPVPPRELVALGEAQILARHLRDQVLEADLRLPAELRLRLARVAEQAVHLRGPEIVRIDPHHGLAGLERGEALVARACDASGLVLAAALPVELDAVFGRDRVDEVTDAALNTSRDDEVFRRRLLEHEPFRAHEVLGVAPVALRVEVADVEAV